MPITQDRMIQVIAACNEYEEAFFTLYNTIKEICLKYEGEEAKQRIWDKINNVNLQPDFRARMILGREKEHFRQRRLKNEAEKQRQRRRYGYKAPAQGPQHEWLSLDLGGTQAHQSVPQPHPIARPPQRQSAPDPFDANDPSSPLTSRFTPDDMRAIAEAVGDDDLPKEPF